MRNPIPYFIHKTLLGFVLLFLPVLASAQQSSYEKAFEYYKDKPLPPKLTRMIGADLPDFSATTLDGEKIELSKLKGKVVVLNFWFIACAPCRLEMPGLNKLVEQFKGEEVEFISIARESEQALRDKFFKEHEFKFKTISDIEQKVHRKLLGLQGYPTTIIIDKEGKIRLMTIGGKIDEDEATKDIQTNIAPLIAAFLK
jgi:peroxiredoxin